MPNLLPLGIWARLGPDNGAGGEPISMAATQPGSLVPQTVIEVWCAGPNNDAQLVWANSADAPTGVTISYNSATVQVTVAWTPHAAPAKADRYDVLRPDGSLAATVMGWASAGYVDTAPRGLFGAYSVVAKLGTVSATPAVSNSLDLRPIAPTAVGRTWATSQVTINWTPNPNRMAAYFAVYRPDGSHVGTAVGRDVTSFVDLDPRPIYGQYFVKAITTEGVDSLTYGFAPALDLSTNISGLTNVWSYNPSGFLAGWRLNVDWTPPAWGEPDSYSIWWDGVFDHFEAGNATSAARFFGFSPVPGETHNVIVVAILSGIAVPSYPNLTSNPRP